MMQLNELLLQLDIGEDQDVEFKLAANTLPKSLWETVSAFANTEGGYLILGIAQDKNKFKIEGISHPAHLIKTVSNTDVRYYIEKHPREIGEHLKELVQRGWLIQKGRGRGTRYQLPSKHYGENSGHYNSKSLTDLELQQLKAIALPIHSKGRVNKSMMRDTIIKLCSEHFLSLKVLADLLKRQPDSLRKHYINEMVSLQLLKLRYPAQINHPQQRYTAAKDTE